MLKHPETGEPITDRLVVGSSNGTPKQGVLKQVHQECWYRLLKLWDEQGYRLETGEGSTAGVLRMSQYELVMAIVGDDSEKAYTRVRRLLSDLSQIGRFKCRSKTALEVREKLTSETWLAFVVPLRSCTKLASRFRPNGAVECGHRVRPVEF